MQRTAAGRAKRIVKWFAHESDAVAHQAATNETLLVGGVGGVTIDALLRADAIAARKILDEKGHQSVSLLQLAMRHVSQVTAGTAAVAQIAPEVAAFLDEKRHVDKAPEETVKNLATRLALWLNLSGVGTLGDVTRESVECLRTRTVSTQTGKPVSPQTRRNDMNAVSSFCSWLLDKRKIDHHPLKGLKRPKVPRRSPPILTTDECGRVLEAAAAGGCGATLAVMLLTGARPSELAETRLYYGRDAAARIEGGKLRGRANRSVPLSAVAKAWLAKFGKPERVSALTRAQREAIGTAAGITWKPDICRHTYISNRLAIVNDDAAVAREAGTSQEVIFRHYHRLVNAADARCWAKLRPKTALTQSGDRESVAV